MSGTTQQIVVGIDGSVASKAALRWAIDEGRVRGATVTAVHAWQVPVEFGMYEGMAVPGGVAEELEKAAEDTVHDVLADVMGADVTVAVVASVRNGPPSKVLVDASHDADLLVVGSEGHGAFVGMLLGSVTMHVVHHAACPVTVVRPDWTPSAT